jgi:hypothetical protein
MKPNENKPLSKREKIQIREIIQQKMASDDRDPVEVIAREFAGNEDAYLRKMAKWHNLWPKQM